MAAVQKDTSIAFWEDGDIPTATASGPLYAPNPWDTMVIGGQRLPGIVEVTATPSKKADTKKASASHGAKTTIHGTDPAEASISITIWTLEQWQVFIPIMHALWPRPGKTGAALTNAVDLAGNPVGSAFDVDHPEFQLVGIGSVIILRAPTSKKARAGKTWTFGCIEFQPSKPTRPMPIIAGAPVAGKLQKTPTPPPANAPAPPSSNPAVVGP